MDALIDRGEYAAALAYCTCLNQASLGLIPRTLGGGECPVRRPATPRQPRETGCQGVDGAGSPRIRS